MRQERAEKGDRGADSEVVKAQCSPRDLTPPTLSKPTIAILTLLTITDQQRALITTIEEQTEKLGRMPSAHEIRMKTSDVSLSRISIDRIHKIIHELNTMLPDEVVPLTLTPHRPHFLHRRDVQQVAEEYRKENYELPPYATLQKLVQERCGVLLSTTTLRFIMRDLYHAVGKSDSLGGEDPSTFRTSRKKLPVSWRNIADAYSEAVEYLATISAPRAPAAEEVGHFLRKAGVTIENDALKFRLRNAPAALKLKVAPYSDLTPAIVRTCHTRLSKKLLRPPTIYELTEAFNDLSLRKSTVDALSLRVLHINKRGESPTIKLNERRRSGVYDQDILRSFKGLSKQLKRAPTFAELTSEVRAQNKKTTIREDSFLRRVTKLQLTLTHPYDLKEPEQELVRSTIATLKTELGRSPLKEEVLQRCARQGAPLSEKDLFRILGAIKKRRSAHDRTALHLASPPVLKGVLKQAIRSVSPHLAPKKLLTHLSSKLRWSTAGIYGIASLIVGSGGDVAGMVKLQADKPNQLHLLAQAQALVWNEHRDIRETTLALTAAFGRAPLAEEVHGELVAQGGTYTLYRVSRTLKDMRAGVYPELQKMLRLGKRPEHEGKLRRLIAGLSPSVDPRRIVRPAQTRFGWTLEGTYEIARSMMEAPEGVSDNPETDGEIRRVLSRFIQRIERYIDHAFDTAHVDRIESPDLDEVMKLLSRNKLPYTRNHVARYLRRRAMNVPGSSLSSQELLMIKEMVQQLKKILSSPPYPAKVNDITTRARKELDWGEREITKASNELLPEFAEELAGRRVPSAITDSESERMPPRAFGVLLDLLPPQAWPCAIREPLVMRHIIAHLTHRLVEARTRGESDSKSLTSLVQLLEHTHELLKPWDLDLTRNDWEGTEPTIDKLLRDAEVLWICLSALPKAALDVEQELFQIRMIEARCCKETGIQYNEANPFSGFAHAVVMAQASGILSNIESKQLRGIPPEHRLNGRWYPYVRGKIQEIASRLGFPRG